MDWIKVALIALQIVQWIMQTKQNNKMMDAGRDEEIAKQAAAILGMTEAGKKMMERINAMDDKAADDFLGRLGDDGPVIAGPNTTGAGKG